MSHRTILTLVSLMILMAVAMPPLARGSECAPVTACFTTGGNCADAIVQALGGAKRTVLVQAYSFTSAPIAKALLDAHKRGVQVQVILHKSQRSEVIASIGRRMSAVGYVSDWPQPTVCHNVRAPQRGGMV